MDEQSIHMSYKTYNILCVIISCGVLIWGIQSAMNFYKMLMIRAAVLTDDVAVIRGLGDNLRQLNSVSTTHAQSLLHTRQATPPTHVSCVVNHVQLTGAIWISRTSLRVNIRRSQQLQYWVIPIAGLDISTTPPTVNAAPGKAIVDSLMAARVCNWTGRAVAVSSSDPASVSISVDFLEAPVNSSYGLLVVPMEVPNTPLVLNVSDQDNTENSGIINDGAGDVEIGAGFGSNGNIMRSRRGQRQQRLPQQTMSCGDSTQHLSFQTMRYALYEVKPLPAGNGIISVPSSDVLGDAYLHTGGVCFYKVCSIYGASTAAEASTPTPPPDTIEQIQDENGAQQSPLATRQTGNANNVDETCVVCLTDRKEVLLLPCRHCCVCSSCLPLIDKCPVCRAAFHIYLVMQQSAVTIAV